MRFFRQNVPTSLYVDTNPKLCEHKMKYHLGTFRKKILNLTKKKGFVQLLIQKTFNVYRKMIKNDFLTLHFEEIFMQQFEFFFLLIFFYLPKWFLNSLDSNM